MWIDCSIFKYTYFNFKILNKTISFLFPFANTEIDFIINKVILLYIKNCFTCINNNCIHSISNIGHFRIFLILTQLILPETLYPLYFLLIQIMVYPFIIITQVFPTNNFKQNSKHIQILVLYANIVFRELSWDAINIFFPSQFPKTLV